MAGLEPQIQRQLSQVDTQVATSVQSTVDATAVTAVSTGTPTSTDTNTPPAASSQSTDSSKLQTARAAIIAQAAAPTTTASTANPLTQAVSALFAAIGLAPNAADSPAVPATPEDTFIAALQLIRREIDNAFFNQTPALNYDAKQNTLLADGSIQGNLNPFDLDSPSLPGTTIPALTYGSSVPSHGTVVVNPDGTFIYTPQAGYTGPDSFTVAVSDAGAGFHIHGWSGLLNMVTLGLLGDRGDAVTATININPPEVPAGLDRNVLTSGLNQPTDLGFLPEGPILIAEKTGAIQVYNNGHLQSTPLITLPVDSDVGRGLLGMAVDPNFTTNHFIYVAYITTDNFERLSRLTITDPSAAVVAADPASEFKLLQGDQQAADDHLGGGLRFGPDGKLYWAVGNNDFYLTHYQISANAQDLSQMYGKILRLNPDGSVPWDNPYAWLPGANPYVYASGFRNPFRMNFTPGPFGQLLVGDVGEEAWEEVDKVVRGGNYGWPVTEGNNGVLSLFGYTDPIYAFPTDSPGSITGILGFADGTQVFIADFNRGWIKQVTCTVDYSSCGNAQGFDYNAGATVSLAQGPDGALYQLAYSAPGRNPYGGVGELARIGPA